MYSDGAPIAESTRLNQLIDCVHAEFLLENPAPPTQCPLKLDPQPNVSVTTRLESTRLLAKVVECPLYYRESTGGFCEAYTVPVITSRGVTTRGVTARGVTTRATTAPTSQIVSSGPGFVIQARTFASITGIDQIVQPVVGVSSGDLIARKRASVIGATTSTGSAFTPIFFRSNGPNTTSSGGPLYVCPPIKTAQDSGVPVARLPVCVPGGRVVA